MNPWCKGEDRGFTLIEVIVTLMVGAIMVAVLAPFFGCSLRSGAEPIVWLQKANSLQRVMENMTADYLANHRSNLAGLRTKINDTANNQYGSCLIAFNGFIGFNVSGAEDPSYDSNNPSSNILKVVIKDGQTGETLSSLFTQ